MRICLYHPRLSTTVGCPARFLDMTNYERSLETLVIWHTAPARNGVSKHILCTMTTMFTNNERYDRSCCQPHMQSVKLKFVCNHHEVNGTHHAQCILTKLKQNHLWCLGWLQRLCKATAIQRHIAVKRGKWHLEFNMICSMFSV